MTRPVTTRIRTDERIAGVAIIRDHLLVFNASIVASHSGLLLVAQSLIELN